MHTQNAVDHTAKLLPAPHETAEQPSRIPRSPRPGNALDEVMGLLTEVVKDTTTGTDELAVVAHLDRVGVLAAAFSRKLCADRDDPKLPRRVLAIEPDAESASEATDETVRQLITIGLTVTQVAGRHAGSAQVQRCASALMALLEASIGRVQQAAFEQRCARRSTTCTGADSSPTQSSSPIGGSRRGDLRLLVDGSADAEDLVRYAATDREPTMRSQVHRRRDSDQQTCTWSGAVTWRDVADKREALFDQLEVPGSSGVRVDVSAVSSIDATGIALLVGANHRAAATGRLLILIDSDGPVSRALARKHLLRDFLVTTRITASTGRTLIPQVAVSSATW